MDRTVFETELREQGYAEVVDRRMGHLARLDAAARADRAGHARRRRGPGRIASAGEISLGPRRAAGRLAIQCRPALRASGRMHTRREAGQAQGSPRRSPATACSTRSCERPKPAANKRFRQARSSDHDAICDNGRHRDDPCEACERMDLGVGEGWIRRTCPALAEIAYG
jgi:hypothetical protein